jgi:protease I
LTAAFSGSDNREHIHRQRRGAMATSLSGKTIAFLATDGVEQVELTEPWQAVERAGGRPELVGLKAGEIRGDNHDEKGDSFSVDTSVGEADAGSYDGLVLPGGTKNPDRLRMDKDAVEFVRSFFDAGKPVAVICHGPWTLVEADVVRGRTITSWPSLQTDLRNAGAEWVDEEVVVDGNLVSSRKPDDLAAFNSTLVEVFAASPPAEQSER